MTAKKKRAAEHTGRPEVRKNTPLLFVLLASLLIFGGYHDFTVLAAGATLAILLLFEAKKADGLPLPSLPALCCLGAIAAGNLLSIPFAVSAGMAFTGFLRTVVWLLFFLYAATYSPEERRDILQTTADFGTVMCLISLIPFAADRLAGISDANGRIDGFFQYANSYSLFLLICFVVILLRSSKKRLDWAKLAALFLGILLSGSRGVFLLMAAALIALGGISCIQKRQWRTPLAVLLAGAALCAAAAVLSDGLVLRRLAAISLSSSSVNGRLLYYLDGLRILLDHPLGIGRGGYLYVQPLYQTGVYTLKHIHNAYLQAALDGGVAAGAAMTALPVILLRKKRSTTERLVIALIAVHSLIDFDTEFSAIMFLLLLCGSSGEKRVHLPGTVPVRAMGTALASIMGVLSLPYTLGFLGSTHSAYALWPFDLAMAEERLQSCATMDEAEAIADRILSGTDTSMLAWDCKFAAATNREDLAGMVSAKYQYLRFNPYRVQVWEEFTSLLEEAYAQADDSLAKQYAQLADEANTLLKEVYDRTGPLAWRIADKPDFDFLETTRERLQKLEERQH